MNNLPQTYESVVQQRDELEKKLLAYEQAVKNPAAYRNKFTGKFFTLEQQPDAVTDTDVYEPVFLAAQVLPKQPDPENKIAQIKRQKALAWLKRVAYENPCMKEVKTCIEVLSAPAQPVSEPKAEGDFLSRLKAEHVELEDRCIKLANFIDINPAFKNLAPRMQRLLKSQAAAMVEYDSILECRIDLIEDAAQQNEPQNIPENIPAQPVSEPYKFPQGWMKGQFAYQDLFNAIGASVVSKHPSIEISVKAFEDSMLAAAPAQDGKSASTELPNHFNLSTNSPVIPDGWKLVPIEPTAAMFHAFNDCDYGRKSMRERYIQMIEAAPARESENG